MERGAYRMNILRSRRNRIVIYFSVLVISVLLMLGSESLGEFIARDWGKSDSWYNDAATENASVLRQTGLLTGGLSGLGLVLELSKLEEKSEQTQQAEEKEA